MTTMNITPLGYSYGYHLMRCRERGRHWVGISGHFTTEPFTADVERDYLAGLPERYRKMAEAVAGPRSRSSNTKSNQKIDRALAALAAIKGADVKAMLAGR